MYKRQHQGLARDCVAYCDLAADRQQRANDIVRKRHALTVSRVNRRNSALADALHPAPKLAVGGSAWVHNSASTIRQGVKANTEANVLKVKLELNGTGPYKFLPVGPCASTETPDGWPLGDNLPYLDLPSDLPVRMLAGAWRWNAASPLPTPTTEVTCPTIYRRG